MITGCVKEFDPGIHQYIFRYNQYIGQLDFWLADEIEQFGKILGITEGSHVLDIGSGLGIFAGKCK